MSRYHDEFTPPVETETDKMVKAFNAMAGQIRTLDNTIKTRPVSNFDVSAIAASMDRMTEVIGKMCEMMKPTKPMTGLSAKRLNDGSWDVKVKR